MQNSFQYPQLAALASGIGFAGRFLSLRAVCALSLAGALAACNTLPASDNGQSASPLLVAQPNAKWFKLNTEAYRGKQDDIAFIDANTGFYVNGAGKIFKTTDGGQNWKLVLHKPGTYFRTIGMINEKQGFAGNIGTEYFPNVSDTTPLYMTADGGESWTAVTAIAGPQVKGLCAIDVLKTSFINAGVLDHRTVIHAAGRVGGPAWLMRSLDGGAHWNSIDMNPHIAAITDVKFFDEANGVIVGADDANIARSHAVVIATHDGGQSWQRVYTSPRTHELSWKVSFPSRKVGYVTVQNYNEDPSVSQRVLAKTMDGGKSWQELPLVNDFKVREFGVGFADDNTGWVGTSTSGFETRDGGQSWQRVDMGAAVNKIRIVPDGKQYVGYAIGVGVYKYATPTAQVATADAIKKP